MSYTVSLTNFEGPLEVLLRLIEKQQLDITEIALSQVTDDYLEYMNNLPLRADDLNWFIEIAAKLVIFKAQALLPEEDQAEDEPGLQDLTEQLQLYRQFRNIAQTFGQLSKKPLSTRPIRPSAINKKLAPANLTTSNIIQAYQSCIVDGLEEKILKSPRFIVKKTTIDHVTRQLEHRFIQDGKIALDELLNGSPNREQAVLYFLAVLEMLKSNKITLATSHHEDEHYVLELENA